MQNEPHSDPAPEREDFGLLLLAAKLAGPLPLCGGCLRPCAECGDGCNDHLAGWLDSPAA